MRGRRPGGERRAPPGPRSPRAPLRLQPAPARTEVAELPPAGRGAVRSRLPSPRGRRLALQERSRAASGEQPGTAPGARPRAGGGREVPAARGEAVGARSPARPVPCRTASVCAQRRELRAGAEDKRSLSLPVVTLALLNSVALGGRLLCHCAHIAKFNS